MSYLVYECNYIEGSISWGDIMAEVGVCGDLYAISRYYQMMQNRLLKLAAEQKFKNRFKPIGHITSQIEGEHIWVNAKIDENQFVDPIVEMEESLIVMVPTSETMNNIDIGIKDVFNGGVMQDELATILKTHQGVFRYWGWNESIIQFFYNEAQTTA